MNLKPHYALAFVGALANATVQAELIMGVSYVYDNAGELNEIAGKDLDGDATPQALTDGLGQSGDYTPTATFWALGQEGTIYLEDNANIQSGQPQPQVTFDLGRVYDLTNVVIHYGVLVGSAVEAPVAVEVDVDSVPHGQFVGFDDSDNSSGFGDIRSLTIDLSGAAGQTVEMRFLGGISPLGRAGNVTRVGLTEIEFSGVPEPAAVACLVTCLAVSAVRRRRPGA